jgi:hypothetical protein
MKRIAQLRSDSMGQHVKLTRKHTLDDSGGGALLVKLSREGRDNGENFGAAKYG